MKNKLKQHNIYVPTSGVGQCQNNNSGRIFLKIPADKPTHASMGTIRISNGTHFLGKAPTFLDSVDPLYVPVQYIILQTSVY